MLIFVEMLIFLKKTASFYFFIFLKIIFKKLAVFCFFFQHFNIFNIFINPFIK